MKVGILTSSRADYGIYLPLLNALKQDPYFDTGILAFGTHLSQKHGHTIDQIKKDGFPIDHEVSHIGNDDSEKAITVSMAKVMEAFGNIWEKERNNYDIVFCLGDRYEMFAAVSAAAPFRIPFAHIHGGETSLGAIDNEFRHCITIFSRLHFVSAASYAEKVSALKGSPDGIEVVGSLSLENLDSISFFSDAEMKEKFGVDTSLPTILVTYHPETTQLQGTEVQGKELVSALNKMKGYQVVITMPNADPMGNTLRRIYEDAARQNPAIRLVENFGTRGYFTAMSKAAIIAGNSSSGIIEAASFGKYVVNIGNRQKGRAVSDNVIQTNAEAGEIYMAMNKAIQSGRFTGENIYYKKNVAAAITRRLKLWDQQKESTSI